MKKYLFGLFTFTLGLAIGLLLYGFIAEPLLARGINEMLQGAILIFIVALTFFFWRWSERKSTSPPPPPKPR